jgi:nucleotide-binding universal stress UspA family protein
LLEAGKKVLTENGLTVRAITRTGSPSGVLVGASASYDLVVLATRSHAVGPMIGLGPVASRLAEHSVGTTLLMRDLKSEAGLRILVAIDGSEGSSRAIDRMAELINLSEAEITLLHVVETPWLHIAADRNWMELEELGEAADEGDEADPEGELEKEFVDEVTSEARAILDRARLRLPQQPTVMTYVYEGFPAERILGEANLGNYDLVVIGATGSADLKHRILGSVSSRVAWDAPCSVLLVGAPHELTEGGGEDDAS